MGNELVAPVHSKYVLSKQNLVRCERQLLEFSGLSENYFHHVDVPSGKFEGKDVYMRTLIVMEPPKNGYATFDKPLQKSPSKWKNLE